jgi:osmoprotectant transport system permease protein
VSPRDRFVDWGWIGDHLDELRADTIEHLRLTFLAVAIGVVVAGLLTVFGLRVRWTLGPIGWFTGVLYTIPSIAFFVALIPVFGLTDDRTVLIPLVSYTLFILVRNFAAAVDGVPAHVRDAADGMGYGRWRRLVAIEVPIALPVIIAGIRIATVTTVGLVTVTALVGFGGLGNQIAAGRDRNFSTQVVAGAGLSIALAIALDVALVLVERALTPWRRAGRRRRAAPVPEPLLEVSA